MSAVAKRSSPTACWTPLAQRLSADEQTFYFPRPFGQLMPERGGLDVTVQTHIQTPANLRFEPLHAAPDG